MEKGSVFDLFAAAAARNPQGAFLCVLPETAAAYGIGAGEITYAEALERTLALSSAYEAAGFGAGQRVGILVENRPAFFWHWFALNRLGVSLVPINPDLRAAEIEYMIAHSDMCAAVVIPSRRKDMEALFGGKVWLETWVKVKSGWADDERALRSLGYE